MFKGFKRLDLDRFCNDLVRVFNMRKFGFLAGSVVGPVTELASEFVFELQAEFGSSSMPEKGV